MLASQLARKAPLSPSVVSDMRRRLPIQNGLMGGVGGGVWSKKDDIRLGDVVVSQPTGSHCGVVQWDFGKTGERREISADWLPG